MRGRYAARTTRYRELIETAGNNKRESVARGWWCSCSCVLIIQCFHFWVAHKTQIIFLHVHSPCVTISLLRARGHMLVIQLPSQLPHHFFSFSLQGGHYSEPLWPHHSTGSHTKWQTMKKKKKEILQAYTSKCAHTHILHLSNHPAQLEGLCEWASTPCYSLGHISSLAREEMAGLANSLQRTSSHKCWHPSAELEWSQSKKNLIQLYKFLLLRPQPPRGLFRLLSTLSK